MVIVREKGDALLIADASVRRLVERRLEQACGDDQYDPDRDGLFVVVQPGDGPIDIEEATGVDVLSDAFGESRYPDAEFTPATEVIEDHGSCYELVFVFTDEGSGLELFLSKTEGMDPELLAMCAAHAVPAAELSEP